MNYKKIMIAFCTALPLSIALRFAGLWFTVETKTGFFKHHLETIGNYMLFIIFLIAFTVGVFGFLTTKKPETPPKTNLFTSIASFGYAISVLYEIFTDNITSTSVLPWQITLLRVTGILSAVFFVIYGAEAFIKFKLPDICTTLPILYLVLRIICDFTAISSLATISDNLILMGAYCTSLWFMLQFAKFYNLADQNKNHKKLLAGGLAAATLCFTQSLPHILINLFSGNSYLHTTVAANFSLLVLGIFILLFVISQFSEKFFGNSEN